MTLLEYRNINPRLARSIANLLEDEFLTDITSDYVSTRIGRPLREYIQSYFDDVMLGVSQSLQLSVAEYGRFTAQCLTEAEEMESFLNIHYAYGQKF